MLTATIVYAINVPIDSISMSCCKSNANAIKAAKKLDSNVACTGTCVRLFTRLNTPNISPSDDIEYKIRGSGYIEPSNVLHSANTAPIVTILWKRMSFNQRFLVWKKCVEKIPFNLNPANFFEYTWKWSIWVLKRKQSCLLIFLPIRMKFWRNSKPKLIDYQIIVRPHHRKYSCNRKVSRKYDNKW